jgi:hypothetical protein
MQIISLDPTDSTASSPSKVLGSFSTRSGLVLDLFPYARAPKIPRSYSMSIFFSACFSESMYSAFFGLLIFAAQTPFMTDGLACGSSINCIKDSRCRIRMPSNCVLETPRMLSFESPVSLFHLRSNLALSLSPSSFTLAPSPIEPASSLGCVRFTLTLGLIFMLTFSPT